MFQLLSIYWPHILFVISIAMGAAAAIHATMTKEEVRAATGWAPRVDMKEGLKRTLDWFRPNLEHYCDPDGTP